MTKDHPIRIQILATNDEAGTAGEAIARAESRRADIAAIGEGQGAEALLVTPAPDEYVNDGFPLVVFARFPAELDEETIFWRQIGLGDELFGKLRLLAVVLDLDAPQGGFLRHIGYMLAAPYRDELDRRELAHDA
jgi:hypothetical protein